MQAVRTARPKLNLVRDHEKATPVVRQWHIGFVARIARHAKALLYLVYKLLARVTRCARLALWARPRPDAAANGTRVKVCLGHVARKALSTAKNAHRAMHRRPVERERAPRVRCELLALARPVVGKELEPLFVGTFEKHGACTGTRSINAP